MRRALVPVLLALSGVLVFVGGLGLWTAHTVYDSRTFARRATSVLDSAAVRQEAAATLTELLVRDGNRQAIAYRPAFETAIEATLDTDTFRSIFRNAIRTAHADLLHGGSGAAGLNLSQSVSIIASTLQLPSSAGAGDVEPSGFATSFADVTQRLGDLGVWRLEETIRRVSVGCLIGALGCAVAAVLLAGNRRRAMWWIGWTLVSVGLFVAALRWAAGWYLQRQIADAGLGRAVRGAFGTMSADLLAIALLTIAYGAVLAGAAATADHAYTPAVARARAVAWLERRRRTSGGALLVGIFAVVAGFVVLLNPASAAVALAVVAGIWLSYVGTVELIRLVRRVTSAPGQSAWWRPVVAGVAVVGVVAAMTAVAVVATSRSATRASDAAPTGCNRYEDLCDLRIDEVIFPATHNSMSSAIYPGWLFGEQLGTIDEQLEGGVRALLFDTHYGIPSSARMPGSNSTIVLTDRARELTHGGFEPPDPRITERAAALTAKTSPAANAKSAIYLCHNYCEMGAVPFSTALAGIKRFVDTHPDDVVLIIIQDATSVADTTQAFLAAGLQDRLATLDPSRPLPTLQDLIDAGTNLVVFAEAGGPDAPPWYQPAYQGWVQETPYAYKSADAFDCQPNRGGTNGSLFLVNHWVTTNGPDPAVAAKANADDVLSGRLRRCLDERGRLPNIVAVDYARGGRLADALHDLNLDLLGEVSGDGGGPSTSTVAPQSSTAPPSTTTPPATTGAPAPATTTPAIAAPIATLTGGDPTAFCHALGPVEDAVEAYGEAAFTEPPAEAGTAELLFAPLLSSVLDPLAVASPQELAAGLDAMRQRAQQASAALTTLGLDPDQLNALRDTASQALASPDPPDGVTLETRLRDAISTVSSQRLTAAAQAFATAGSTDLSALLAVGTVTPDAARDAGYDCLVNS